MVKQQSKFPACFHDTIKTAGKKLIMACSDILHKEELSTSNLTNEISLDIGELNLRTTLGMTSGILPCTPKPALVSLVLFFAVVNAKIAFTNRTNRGLTNICVVLWLQKFENVLFRSLKMLPNCQTKWRGIQALELIKSQDFIQTKMG